jgi:hypothetical protein
MSQTHSIYWLIDWLFTVLHLAQEFFTYLETSPLPVSNMLGARGLWACHAGLGRDLYRSIPTVTWDLGFSGLIQRTTPFSLLLWQAWGCRGPILTRILTRSHTVSKTLQRWGWANPSLTLFYSFYDGEKKTRNKKKQKTITARQTAFRELDNHHVEKQLYLKADIINSIHFVI